jgi:hypothetical protein
MSEWYLFSGQMSIAAAISYQEQVTYIWWDDGDYVCFIHANLDYYSANSMKQHLAGRNGDPH